MFSNSLISKSSNRQIVKSPNRQIAKLPNRQIISCFFFYKNTPTIASLSLILKADTRKPLFAKIGHFQLLFPCLKMPIVLSCCAVSKTRYRLTDSSSRFAEKPYCRNIYLSNGQNRVLKAFCADCQSRS